MPTRLPASQLEAVRRALADDDRSQTTRLDIAVTDSIRDQLGSYTPSRNELAALSEPRKNWYLCAVFESESNSGGIDNFLGEAHEGQFATETAKALRYFGATRLADILDRAMKLVPAEILSADHATRSEWFSENDNDLFEELNDEFFPIGTSEIERLRYASENPSEFFEQ